MPNIETDSSRQESVNHTIAGLFPDKWFFVFIMFEIHLITVLFCVFLHKFLSVCLDFLSLLYCDTGKLFYCYLSWRSWQYLLQLMTKLESFVFTR